jgi:hypothetical protein
MKRHLLLLLPLLLLTLSGLRLETSLLGSPTSQLGRRGGNRGIQTKRGTEREKEGWGDW